MTVKLASLRRGLSREEIVEILRREEIPPIADLAHALVGRQPIRKKSWTTYSSYSSKIRGSCPEESAVGRQNLSGL
jgi:hypothetical protein